MRLSAPTHHGTAAGAKKYAAEKIEARDNPGMNRFRGILGHYFLHLIEGIFINNRLPGILDTYRGFAAMDSRVTRPAAEYQCTAVYLVIENLVHGSLSPALAGTGENLFPIKRLRDLLTAYPLQRHLEYPANNFYGY